MRTQTCLRWCIPGALLLLLMLMGLASLLAAPVAASGEPSVWTPSADYEPHETVPVYGWGFLPGQVLDIVVIRPDGSIGPGDRPIPIAVSAILALEISKTDSADPVAAGTLLAYTVSITTAGGLQTGIVITDVLAAGMGLWGCSGGCGYDAVSRLVTWTVPSLADGSSTNVTLVVQALSSGVWTNRACTSSTEVTVAVCINEDTTVLAQATPTQTATQTWTATPDSTIPVATPTQTPTATPTSISTIPVVTPTQTPTATPTSISTIPVVTPTQTPTPTPTSISTIPVVTPTQTPTATPVCPIVTATSTPVCPVVTSTPVCPIVTATATPVCPIVTATPVCPIIYHVWLPIIIVERPTATPTRTATATWTATATVVQPTVVATIAVPGLRMPKALVLDDLRSKLYVVGRDSNDVHAIDLTTLMPVQRYDVGMAPFGATMMGGVLYVVNYDSGSISRINLDSHTNILPDIPVGNQPTWIAADPLTQRLWVPLHTGGAVDVVLFESVWKKVATGPGPFAVAVNTNLRLAYVGNRDSKSITVLNLDSANIMATLYPGGSPFAMAVNEASGRLYVLHGPPGGDCPANRLAIYDSSSVKLRDVPAGDTCDGGWVAVNALNGRVYAAATADDELWMFDANGNLRDVLTASDGIGRQPFGLAVDPVASRVYIGNKLDNNITVVSDP